VFYRCNVLIDRRTYDDTYIYVYFDDCVEINTNRYKAATKAGRGCCRAANPQN
jgi:hypothetical protein